MIEISTQLLDKCPVCKNSFGPFYFPYGEEAIEKTKEYKINQILRTKIWGLLNPRSAKQLNLYWACCTYLAEILSDIEAIFEKRDIDFKIKTSIAKENPWLIKRFAEVGGKIYHEPISIAYKNMKRLEANNYFNLAYGEMENMTGIDRDTIIFEAKSRMKSI